MLPSKILNKAFNIFGQNHQNAESKNQEFHVLNQNKLSTLDSLGRVQQPVL